MINRKLSDLNWEYPITSVTIGQNGLLVHRSAREPKSVPHGKREKITQLSKRSLHKLAWIAQTTPVNFRSMMTLTYGQMFPATGKQLKTHLNRFLTMLRRREGDLSYLWFLEFQAKRLGKAPHVHLLLTCDALNPDFRQEYGHMWIKAQKLEPFSYSELATGDVKCLRAQALKVATHKTFWEPIRKKDGARFYVTKYATKTCQKDIPPYFTECGRFWGCSRDVNVFKGEVMSASESQVRTILAYHGVDERRWQFLPRHIWFNTGQECDK